MWSSDRREWAGRCDRWVKNFIKAGATSIQLIGTAGDGVAWIDRQIGQSWDRLAIHVRRDLWLVNVPEFSTPMRSAELPQGEKR